MSTVLLARKPIGKIRHDFAATNVTTAAWVQISSSCPSPCSALEIFNGGGSILKISTGTAGNEDASELPYYILPGGSELVLPFELNKSKRISVKAVDLSSTAGSLVLNLFG